AQALQLRPTDRVLEIGTGSGYAAAVLSRLAQMVYTIERFPELAQGAYERFMLLGYRNIEVVVRDGTAGLPELAPFDAITVAAAAPQVP
ncbi:protein-L-isoaspartate O-methyltransferase family protein, partial [Streptomyces sp. URMC 126]|uniref:protein-L-isoaspartate O-methyltransferase family protein n=1 Tax=Streptomyces sp. URMC 126 TaxID=3423401 RepID=UPI003F1AA0A2